MKASMVVLALGMGLATYAALPAAADEEKGRTAARLVERLQDLQLTDDQETKIAEIRKEYRPKVSEARKKLGGLVRKQMEKVRSVLTADQQKKLAELKEERKERREGCLSHAIAHLKELDLTDAEMSRIGKIREEYRPKIRKALEGLKGILTDEQRKARTEALTSGKKRSDLLASLKLSDGQKKKVEVVAKEVGSLVRGEMEEVRDLLSESQKEKLAELKAERRERVRDRRAHRIANFKDLNLTADQVRQIAEIRQEHRPKIHEAGNELRTTVRDELKDILAVLKKE